MRRRPLLAALAVTAGSAGCLAGDEGSGDDSANGADEENDVNATGAGDDSVVGRLGGEPDRPTCTVEATTVEVETGDGTENRETAATVPYPDAPSSFQGDDLLEYVVSFDHAFLTHDILCDREGPGEILNISHSIARRQTFDWYDDIEVVFLLRYAGATAGGPRRRRVGH